MGKIGVMMAASAIVIFGAAPALAAGPKGAPPTVSTNPSAPPRNPSSPPPPPSSMPPLPPASPR